MSVVTTIELRKTNTGPWGEAGFRGPIDHTKPCRVHLTFGARVTDVTVTVSRVQALEKFTNFSAGAPTLSGDLVARDGGVTTSRTDDFGSGNLSWSGLTGDSLSFDLESTGGMIGIDAITVTTNLRLMGTEKEESNEPQGPADVKITHIFFDGAVSRTESDEYVELKNQGAGSANLSNWRIRSGNNQDFIFPAGSTLKAGQSIRVYTNQIHPESGGYSFASKRSVWNNRGGTGELLNAAGEQVSKYAYGDQAAKTRDIPDVLREQGVPGCTVEATARAPQEKLKGSVDFLTALELALKSLIEDPAGGDDYTAATAVQENWDDGADADAAGLQKMIRDHVNGQQMSLLTEETLGDASESIQDCWIFQLSEGMGDLHYIYVDRSGAKKTCQEIS
ncbi:MAG: lamin tail domain-containing protein [Nannocystaceae bacterium]